MNDTRLSDENSSTENKFPGFIQPSTKSAGGSCYYPLNLITTFQRNPARSMEAFTKKTGDVSQTTTVTIQVDNIKEHMKKIKAAGGKSSGEPMDIPGVGWFASFFDTEGNRVNLLQPH